MYPEGGGYTTSVEYLCRRGPHNNSVEYPSTWGGVHHRSGIFIQRGGVHHLSGIFFPASHFPQCSIFSPFFFFGGGGCSPLLHGLPFFPTLNFHDGFFSGGWLCLGGGVADCSLSLSERKEGKEGLGTTLLSDYCSDVFYFMSLTRDAKPDFRPQTLYT